MLDEAAYKTHVTGSPAGVVYAVTNPENGASFDFAGFANGHLLFTIASLLGAVQPDGTLLEDTARTYLGLAAVQLKAAGNYPIQWVCQDPDDAAALQRLLEDHDVELGQVSPLGIEAITVTP